MKQFDLHSGAFASQAITKQYEIGDPPILYLPDEFPRRRYVAGVAKSTYHMGQLKLLLSIILFMDKISEKHQNEKMTMIYAGMAPGRNMKLVADLYPNMKIIGYDPAPFDEGLRKLKNVELHNEFVTDNLVEELAENTILKQNRDNELLLFVSDIRLDPYEEDIVNDMRSQERWVRILRPDYSLLKFRLSWDRGDEFEYLQGTIQLQQFAPQTSTETRLFVEKDDIDHDIKYDPVKYEEQLFHYNTVKRLQSHKKWLSQYGNLKIPGLCTCGDCAAFVMICDKYVKRYPHIYVHVKDLLWNAIHITHPPKLNMFKMYSAKQIKHKNKKLSQLLEEVKTMMDNARRSDRKFIKQHLRTMVGELKYFIGKYNKL